MTRLRRIILISVVPFALVLGGCERYPEWTTESGLKVIELDPGDGKLPRKGDGMSIVYTAWYVDGEQFDSYQDRTAPYRFRLGFGKVLPGLDEGVATMRPGARRILILPPELAFGKEGKGLVPADAWVKFEVELLEVEPGPVPPLPWNDTGHEIHVSESGLQWVDFAVGEGESPTPDSQVVVHFSGFLDDGTLFDSSYYNGRPFRFSLAGGELILGWIEGILSMKEGGQRKLIIPPHLGYGEAGYGKSIPPDATLTYDITLLRVYESVE